jgi:protoporphyrinogen/coproporphyrinogen III oxidase
MSVPMRVAIIGAGVAGLAAAHRLVEAGVDAIVLDGAARAGGGGGTSPDGGFVREHAATAVLASAADGLAGLADELGVTMETASPAAKQRWIWIDGALKRLPRGPLDFVRTDLLTRRGKLALLREPLRARRDTAAVGDESVYDFAVRRLGAEAARALVAPFVTGVYAADAHDVSLAAGFPALAALDARGGLVRGGIAKMLRGPRGPKRAKGRRRGLLAPQGGMQTIVDALVASLGARVRLGDAVASVMPEAGGVAIAMARGHVERFDGAVLAVPASAVAALVSASIPPLAAKLDGFVRAPAAIVYLGYPRAAVPHGTDGFGFLVAQGETLRVLGVVMESVVWPDRAPDGAILLRCIFGGARDPSACGLDDAALIARADVARALGVDGAPVHASVVRWDEGVAQMPVGHGDRLAAVDALARAQRLVLAGAGFHGVGVNDLVADARRVVDEVKAWT